ncbi:MAG TPA: DegT/DnrJ/EryC1/StrS family aminotransferase, partial [Gammaproteobacteria bacterium]|nr:DegT/DnrJ/EryC1/StrS family aminotransferase [Gammaproteobacteria bacterium]
MSISMLPPVGDPIVLAHDERANRRLRQSWYPYQPVFYASGTAALAAAVTAALAVRPGRREVVLPGYGCPALVSAVLYAGAQPVLVDLEPGRPWLALAELTAAVGSNTAAVIAVNFLGIPERLGALAKLTQATDALLIEDSAQAYPPVGIDDQRADLVILSFGRGKPVSLLGGGAVLCREPMLAACLPKPAGVSGSRRRTQLEISAYNCLRRPWLYWIPQALPLGLGETRYQPLSSIAAMDPVRQQALGAAVERQRKQGDTIRRLRSGPARAGVGLTDLAAVCGSRQQLLRYPLLAPTAVDRERVVRALNRAGLGASALYGSVLPEVRDMPAGLVHGDLPQAR